MKKIITFEQAQTYLSLFIPKESKFRFSGEKGLVRAKYLLHLLDNPQNKIKVVHIAGTSGKGSTAYLISLLLGSLNLKVGLHLSPHLIDVRERMQINNQLIDKDKFVYYLNQLVGVIEKITNSDFGKPTYFEITTALAFYIFWKEKVDYAVVETGLGGLYDATNTIDSQNKVAVLTKIGLDHMEVLGNTISQIALQKAEIIHKNNLVVSINQLPQAKKIINNLSKLRCAEVNYIKKYIDFLPLVVEENRLVFNFKFHGIEMKNVHLLMMGSYQIENCALALCVLVLILKRDGLSFNERRIRELLENAHFPGRMDKFVINGKTLIIDGAHNPQKMRSLLYSLKKIYPAKKFTFVLAFKKGKDYKTMLKQILPFAKSVIFTGFMIDNQDLVNMSEDPKKVAQAFRQFSAVQYKTIKDIKSVVAYITKQKDNVVVTGSLYLLSEIYPLLKKYM